MGKIIFESFFFAFFSCLIVSSIFSFLGIKGQSDAAYFVLVWALSYVNISRANEKKKGD